MLKGHKLPSQVNITPNGRMSLPADLRKRMGLADGGTVFVEETDEGIILRTAAQAVARSQALAKRFAEGASDLSVDAFLARRPTESSE